MNSIQDHCLTEELSTRINSKLPKLKGSMKRHGADISQTFLATDLIFAMPCNLMIECNLGMLGYKVRYPKIACSMVVVADNLPEALGEMVLLLERNGYMEEWK